MTTFGSLQSLFTDSSGKRIIMGIPSINDISEYSDIQPSFHFKKGSEETTPAQSTQLKELKADGAVYLPLFHFRCACYTDMG